MRYGAGSECRRTDRGLAVARLIENAANSADVTPDALGAIRDRLARHEHILVELLDRVVTLERPIEPDGSAKAASKPVGAPEPAGHQTTRNAQSALRKRPGAIVGHIEGDGDDCRTG